MHFGPYQIILLNTVNEPTRPVQLFNCFTTFLLQTAAIQELFLYCTAVKHEFHTAQRSSHQVKTSSAYTPRSQKFRISNVKSICMPCCCLMKLSPINHLLAYFSLHSRHNFTSMVSLSITKMLLNINIIILTYIWERKRLCDVWIMTWNALKLQAGDSKWKKDVDKGLSSLLLYIRTQLFAIKATDSKQIWT